MKHKQISSQLHLWKTVENQNWFAIRSYWMNDIRDKMHYGLIIDGLIVI